MILLAAPAAKSGFGFYLKALPGFLGILSSILTTSQSLEYIEFTQDPCLFPIGTRPRSDKYLQDGEQYQLQIHSPN